MNTSEFIRSCISQGSITPFYASKEWRRLRRTVLASDKQECQICKGKGIYTRADHVHHVNYVKVHPELALSTHYVDDEGKTQRNLISVCKNCHETVCHPERLRWNVKEQLNEERW